MGLGIPDKNINMEIKLGKIFLYLCIRIEY